MIIKLSLKFLVLEIILMIKKIIIEKVLIYYHQKFSNCFWQE